MAQTVRFFDSVAYDEVTVARALAIMRMTGVLKPITGAMAVTTGGGLSVNVGTGEAWVKGYWYQNDASLNKVIASNSSGSIRYDRIVLRLNRGTRTVSVVVIQGTPGAGTPALVQIENGTWDVPLALVQINSGAGTPTAITDQRAYSQFSGANTTSVAPEDIAAQTNLYSLKGGAGNVLEAGLLTHSNMQNNAMGNIIGQGFCPAQTTITTAGGVGVGQVIPWANFTGINTRDYYFYYLVLNAYAVDATNAVAYLSGEWVGVYDGPWRNRVHVGGGGGEGGWDTNRQNTTCIFPMGYGPALTNQTFRIKATLFNAGHFLYIYGGVNNWYISKAYLLEFPI